jgi:hypothetical protein
MKLSLNNKGKAETKSLSMETQQSMRVSRRDVADDPTNPGGGAILDSLTYTAPTSVSTGITLAVGATITEVKHGQDENKPGKEKREEEEEEEEEKGNETEADTHSHSFAAKKESTRNSDKPYEVEVAEHSQDENSEEKEAKEKEAKGEKVNVTDVDQHTHTSAVNDVSKLNNEAIAVVNVVGVAAASTSVTTATTTSDNAPRGTTGRWTKERDTKLVALVREHGTQVW